MYEKIGLKKSQQEKRNGRNEEDVVEFEKECGFCNRPKSGVTCRDCGSRIENIRARRVCRQHPRELFVMDLARCPSCKSENLEEIGGRRMSVSEGGVDFGYGRNQKIHAAIPNPTTPGMVAGKQPPLFWGSSSVAAAVKTPKQLSNCLEPKQSARPSVFREPVPVRGSAFASASESETWTLPSLVQKSPAFDYQKRTTVPLNRIQQSTSAQSNVVNPTAASTGSKSTMVVSNTTLDISESEAKEKNLPTSSHGRAEDSSDTNTTMRCSCKRKVKYLLCNLCGYFLLGDQGYKKRIPCPQHPQNREGYDRCPECHSEDIEENADYD